MILRQSNAAGRVLGMIAGGLGLVACTTGPLDDARSWVQAGRGAGDLHAPVMPMSELRFASTVRQKYDFSCGSAALATLLVYNYGDTQNEESVFLGMWRDGDKALIRRQGFSLLDMKRYLAARGMRSEGYRVSLDEISSVGVPGVALVNLQGYHHFVAVKGVDDRDVLVGDPALGLRRMPRREFQSAWNGIYFVVTDPPAPTKIPFNSAAQWGLLPSARLRLAGEPLSQQALAVAAPFTLTDF